MIVAVIAGIIDAFLFPENLLGVVGGMWTLAILLPSLAVAIRRLHDINKVGWWYLIIFIPLIGAIILIVWACRKGDASDNRFGPDPLAGIEAE